MNTTQKEAEYNALMQECHRLKDTVGVYDPQWEAVARQARVIALELAELYFDRLLQAQWVDRPYTEDEQNQINALAEKTRRGERLGFRHLSMELLEYEADKLRRYQLGWLSWGSEQITESGVQAILTMEYTRRAYLAVVALLEGSVA
jgi:hypothetical protein